MSESFCSWSQGQPPGARSAATTSRSSARARVVRSMDRILPALPGRSHSVRIRTLSEIGRPESDNRVVTIDFCCRLCRCFALCHSLAFGPSFAFFVRSVRGRRARSRRRRAEPFCGVPYFPIGIGAHSTGSRRRSTGADRERRWHRRSSALRELRGSNHATGTSSRDVPEGGEAPKQTRRNREMRNGRLTSHFDHPSFQES